MMRDPPGDDGPEFPALAACATATALSVLSTRYLHLFCGNPGGVRDDPPCLDVHRP